MKKIFPVLLFVWAFMSCQKKTLIIVVPPTVICDTTTLHDTVATNILGDWRCVRPSAFNMHLTKMRMEWDSISVQPSFPSITSIDTIYQIFGDGSIMAAFGYTYENDTLKLYPTLSQPFIYYAFVRE